MAQIPHWSLSVAVISDPDFPPLDDALVTQALEYASEEFALRFGVARPEFSVIAKSDVEAYFRRNAGADANESGNESDPKCKRFFDARYKGSGPRELTPYRERAKKFFERWPVEELAGFFEPEERGGIRSYEDVYERYAERYVAAVDAMKRLKTPKGRPLIEPERSTRRSHAAWLCALARQNDVDIVMTNGFILADLMTEPHPHAVFGKTKIGGLATESQGRHALEGQALLASTFGIDTRLPQFSELPGPPPTDEERARILGAYLVAHEIAHAVFAIPDVFDHPEGCLMTSRPGTNYRDGLRELETTPRACPKCRPYVEARTALDAGRSLLSRGDAKAALSEFVRAGKLLPKQLHGGRRRRMSVILLDASRASRAAGDQAAARSFAKTALELDPTSRAATDLAKTYRD